MSNDVKGKKRGRKAGSKGHCSYCGEPGHYAKTCKVWKTERDELGLDENEKMVEVPMKTGVDPDDIG